MPNLTNKMPRITNEILDERIRSLQKEVNTLNDNFKDYKTSLVPRGEYDQYKQTVDAKFQPLTKLVYGAITAAIGGFISALYALISKG